MHSKRDDMMQVQGGIACLDDYAQRKNGKRLSPEPLFRDLFRTWRLSCFMFWSL